VDVLVSRSRFLLGLLLASALIGCHAQAPQANADAKLDRKIEILVRSQLSVPPDWNIAVGARSPSAMSGYDTVSLLFSPSADPKHQEKLDFLIAKDNSALARLSKWDLNKTPEDTITVANRPVRGTEAAKVEIVNYDDLECPYCAKMHAELFPETLDHYKGLVKIVYKDDPLVEIHPWALHAAVDANCLAHESPAAYWHYVDYLHTHGEDITGPDRDPRKSNALLDKLAAEEGVKASVAKEPLDACIAKQDQSAVRTSMQEASSLHIDGTPTLFVNGERVAGAQPLAVVWSAIDRALQAEGVTPPPEPGPSAAANAAKEPGAGTQ
jgi:protein-disulfide isomerase